MQVLKKATAAAQTIRSRRHETICVGEGCRFYWVDADELAARKQARRDEDARRLREGEVTREELSRENSFIDVSIAKPRWDLASKNM